LTVQPNLFRPENRNVSVQHPYTNRLFFKRKSPKDTCSEIKSYATNI